MKKDQHVNTSMSKGNKACMEDYIRDAYKKSVDEITVVDEFNPQDEQTLNVEDYYYEYIRFWKNEITDINLGIEVVCSSEAEDEIKEVISSYPFDLVVGTTEIITDEDSKEDVYKEYLQNVLSNILTYKDAIDVISFPIGNLEELAKTDSKKLSKYMLIIDDILKELIRNNIGLEINSAALKESYSFKSTAIAILKRYRELGGNIITIGSYANNVEDLSLYFETVYNILENVGFKTISQFHKRIPEQIELKRLKEVV